MIALKIIIVVLAAIGFREVIGWAMDTILNKFK
jgi:hypothetical protein